MYDRKCHLSVRFYSDRSTLPGRLETENYERIARRLRESFVKTKPSVMTSFERPVLECPESAPDIIE